jgi:hypothetical protein
MDLVLIRALRTPSDETPGEKFYAKWLGPYRVSHAYPNGVSYRIHAMDDTTGTFIEHVNNIKRFIPPRQLNPATSITCSMSAIGCLRLRLHSHDHNGQHSPTADALYLAVLGARSCHVFLTHSPFRTVCPLATAAQGARSRLLLSTHYLFRLRPLAPRLRCITEDALITEGTYGHRPQ